MLVVTTPFIEGKKVKKYVGPVFCQVTRGVGSFRSAGASWKAMTGGRSAGHEMSIVEVRATAVAEMVAEAQSLGANALIGLAVDIDMLSGDTLILCKGYATAVVLE